MHSLPTGLDNRNCRTLPNDYTPQKPLREVPQKLQNYFPTATINYNALLSAAAAAKLQACFDELPRRKRIIKVFMSLLMCVKLLQNKHCKLLNGDLAGFKLLRCQHVFS